MQGEWGGTRKESWKSRANWRACFFRAPLTAPSEGLCYFLFPPPPPLSLSHITSLQEEERRGAERGGKRLVSTVMADERERGRFCTDAHLFSLCLLPPPLCQSFLSQTACPPTLSSPLKHLSLCVLIRPPFLHTGLPITFTKRQFIPAVRRHMLDGNITHEA